MVIVKTKNELKRAIERKQFPIKCVGELATQLTKKKKRAKKAKIGGALLALGGVGGDTIYWWSISRRYRNGTDSDGTDCWKCCNQHR